MWNLCHDFVTLMTSKKKDLRYCCKSFFLLNNGALDRSRTCNRSVRSRVLYPVELQAHILKLKLKPKFTI